MHIQTIICDGEILAFVLQSSAAFVVIVVIDSIFKLLAYFLKRFNEIDFLSSLLLIDNFLITHTYIVYVNM